jgi:hypothetical protein
MQSPRIINLKKFTKPSGKLLPITFNNKFPIKVKRMFLFMEKKNINGVIMHTKNVLRYLSQLRAKLK